MQMCIINFWVAVKLIFYSIVSSHYSAPRSVGLDVIRLKIINWIIFCNRKSRLMIDVIDVIMINELLKL